ncbi:MAG: ankyrin repeat domain-containing protein [Gammaproteobacteria bacterium]|nr:ankyrin repeat domain-containing protein [Gammaproteobacteria bacterium]
MKNATIAKSVLLALGLGLTLGCTMNTANTARISAGDGTHAAQAGGGERAPALSQDQKDMMTAAWNGQMIEVERLLREGVDPDSLGHFGVTALSLAAQNNQTRVVKLLLDHGADPNLQDTKGGWFPLMWAAYNGNNAVVTMLLGHGADVNLRNAFGETAMIHAAFEGRDDTVRLLLDRGADYTVKNDRGFDAMKAAQNKGYYRIVEMLIEAGADKADAAAGSSRDSGAAPEKAASS